MKKNSFLQIVLFFIIDLIIDGILIIMFNLNGLSGIITLFLLCLFCALIYKVLSFLRFKISKLFGINIVINALIFYFILLFWINHFLQNKYEIKTFSMQASNYEVTINKENKSYSISKALNADYSALKTEKWGKILIKQDTVFLLDSLENPQKFVYKNKLIGYPGANNTFDLKDQ